MMPETLQKRTIELAHEGHQGMTKTKRHLRARVWFPKMDLMVEEAIKRCLPCQVSTKTKQRTPIQPSKLPDGPWEELSIDFYTLSAGEEIMVVIDDFSRFPVTEIVKSTAFSQVGPKLNHMLSMFGVPKLIKTDNGLPFNGKEFKEFADHLGFHHRKVAPVWPEANGEVERFMKTLGKLMRTVEAEEKDWKVELETFLRSYRNTLHSGINSSPAEVLYGRQWRNRLPDLMHTDEAYKTRMKLYADQRRRTREHGIQVGDWVLLRKEKKLLRKTEPFYEVEPYRVIEVKESMISAENQKRSITRNCSCFKKLEGGVNAERGQAPPPDPPAEQQRREPDVAPQQRGERRRRLARDQAAGSRRSGRERSVPVYLEDYETGTGRRR